MQEHPNYSAKYKLHIYYVNTYTIFRIELIIKRQDTTCVLVVMVTRKENKYLLKHFLNNNKMS